MHTVLCYLCMTALVLSLTMAGSSTQMRDKKSLLPTTGKVHTIRHLLFMLLLLRISKIALIDSIIDYELLLKEDVFDKPL